MALKSVRRTPGYIYLMAFVLAAPTSWLLVGAPGENVPGMIGMVIMIVLFGAFSIGLESLRRSFFEKHNQ
jgi:polyferredoxin